MRLVLSQLWTPPLDNHRRILVDFYEDRLPSSSCERGEGMLTLFKYLSVGSTRARRSSCVGGLKEPEDGSSFGNIE
jgi:hypothetical protein